MRRILIAEDEPRIASFLEKGLRSSGFATTVADDGQSALRVACSGGVELVILDLGLPIMDGLTVLRELRGSGLDLPVVILTARQTPTDVAAGLDAGADEYITKPFRFADLLAHVTRLLDGADEQNAGRPPPAPSRGSG